MMNDIKPAMPKISIEEQYSESTSVELMSIMSQEHCEEDKVKLMFLLRQALRKEEQTIRERIKQSKEDSKEEKRLLKKTHVALMDTRKEYLSSYKNMNAIMTGKSMLKHLSDFSDTVTIFKEKSNQFFEALDSHLENLAKVKRSQSQDDAQNADND